MDFTKFPLFLAPLAGLSDAPFRTLAVVFGCDASVSEMISANALVFESRTKNAAAKSLSLAQKSPFERDFFVQISGENLANIAAAVEILNDIEGVAGIDLNCGCPVPKVVRQGAGAALLLDPAKICRAVEVIKSHSRKPLTSVKLRLGFAEKNLADFVGDIAAAGADFLAIHARTRTQGYGGQPDYAELARAAAAARAAGVPVLANGNISAQNVAAVARETGAAGAMIGREAVGRAWVFAQAREAVAQNAAQSPRENWRETSSNSNLDDLRENVSPYDNNEKQNLASGGAQNWQNRQNLSGDLAKNAAQNWQNAAQNQPQNFSQNPQNPPQISPQTTPQNPRENLRQISPNSNLAHSANANAANPANAVNPAKKISEREFEQILQDVCECFDEFFARTRGAKTSANLTATTQNPTQNLAQKTAPNFATTPNHAPNFLAPNQENLADIFAAASRLRLPPPRSMRQIGLVALAHLQMMRTTYEARCCGLFRKHLHEYSRGFLGSAEFRQRANCEGDFARLCALIKAFFGV